MAYTYKGTKITGTSTTAKKFTKSGIASAKVNDTYLNTEKGHVYKCTKKGKPSEAEWAYQHTDIIGFPDLTISGLGAPKRMTSGSNTRIMKSKWKVPSDLTNSKKGRRATGLKIYWWLDTSKKEFIEGTTTKGASATSAQINLDNVKLGKTTYTRSSFYPFSGKPKLKAVSVGVAPYNSKGQAPVTIEKRSFTAPPAPSISGFSFNTENGEVSCTITASADGGYDERYDTRYKVTVKNSRTDTTSVPYDDSSTSSSIPITVDSRDYQQLSYGQYIRIKVTAWSRGYAGDSKKVDRTFYVAYPAKATIKKVKVSSASSRGKCTALIKTNSSKQHPVDRVKLEYLANVEYATPGAIPGDALWTTTDILDDAQCNALAIGVSELIPDRGNHTWLRLKTYHASETVLYRYSDYMEVKQLYTPPATAADDRIDIISVTPGADGRSLVVQMGWNASGTDDATGTELSWATESDAWKSTKNPDDYSFEWSDGAASAGGKNYRDSATITIKDLAEGEKYYVRARRYLEGDPTTYSPYCKMVTSITSEIPNAVVAVCDTYVPKGSSLPVYWTFSGNGLQRSWRIVASTGVVLANGNGSIGATQIGWSRLAPFANNGALTFHVEVSTGSEFVSSENHTIRLVNPPTLSITGSSLVHIHEEDAETHEVLIDGDFLQTNNLSVNVHTSQLCDLIAIITSQGASGQYPQGLLRQTAGDTIYSNVLSPIYTAGSSGWNATVNFPTGLDFWDLGNYTLSLVAVDRTTGLKSDEATLDFGILWTHQAPVPADAVTLTPIDETDDTGAHRQAVEIVLTPPTDSAETDVYDIYRLTGDGASLIGRGFPLTFTATDEYAPFGQAITLSYRLAVRTADGDVAFSDIEYVAEGNAMRFDWAEGSLELPYNLSISDSYAKDVEIRKHLNGDSDGYWNQGIERKGSLSSDVIRLIQEEDIIKARQLARYPGAVFVRLPDGSAYEADVQVSDMSTEGVIMAIAVDATEIALTDEFMLPTPNTVDEEES